MSTDASVRVKICTRRTDAAPRVSARAEVCNAGTQHAVGPGLQTLQRLLAKAQLGLALLQVGLHLFELTQALRSIRAPGRFRQLSGATVIGLIAAARTAMMRPRTHAQHALPPGGWSSGDGREQDRTSGEGWLLCVSQQQPAAARELVAA